MLHIYRTIAGLNGRISFITKRNKKNKKKYIIFIEVPITRNIEQLNTLISSLKYDRISESSKIVLEPLDNGTTIHILKGILVTNELTRNIISDISSILSKILELIERTK